MYRLLNQIFHSRLLFGFTLMVIFYGLFLIPNSGEPNRVWNEINNLGHIGAFLIVWMFVFNLFPRITRLSTTQLFVVVLVTTLAVAELIEIIQGWIGRDNEWQDVWDSGVGALLAVVFSSTQIRRLAQWSRHAWRALALIALLLVPWSIWSNLADEVILRRQFPVLCDFSTPFAMSRWHANAATIQEQQTATTGQRYLGIEFRPGLYSTVSLVHFYPDWHAYKHLILEVTNPDSHTLTVILRVHDRQHKRHQYALNDRFNRKLMIKPGRQRIDITIADVEKAPATRKMDLQHMEDLSLFTMQSRTYHHLYLHKIFLE